MNIPTKCLHCCSSVEQTQSLDVNHYTCRNCIAPDEQSSYLLNGHQNNDIVYASIYFDEINLGVNLNFENNFTQFFLMSASLSGNSLAHKVILTIDFIP